MVCIASCLAGADSTTLPFSLPLYFSKSASTLDIDQDRLAGHRSIGSGRPGQRNADQRLILRLDHVRFKMFRGPAAAERSPLFFFRRQTVLGHSLHHPIRRGFVARRTGETRAIHIGQVEHVIHHLRILEGFGLDPIDDQQIHLFAGQQQQRNAELRQSKVACEVSFDLNISLTKVSWRNPATGKLPATIQFDMA